MAVNYYNTYVAGFCLLPTYLVVSFALLRVSLIVWCIGVPIMIYVAGQMYKGAVLQPNKNMSVGKRYIGTFIGQIAFWYFVGLAIYFLT